jgi:predicted DNA-binding transcriptional regulator AlpA
MSEPRYLTQAEVAARVGLAKDTIRRYRQTGGFPPPDQVIGRMPGWLPETVDAWNDNRPRRSVK